MIDFINLSRRGIKNLKKAEVLIIQLLNDPRSRWANEILNKVLSLIREVGATSKETKGE